MCMVTAMLHIKKGGDEMKRLTSLRTVRILCNSFRVCSSLLINNIALALAMSRDGSSGGVVRMCVITEDSVERLFVPGNELPKFWEGREVLGASTSIKEAAGIVPMAIEV